MLKKTVLQNVYSKTCKISRHFLRRYLSDEETVKTVELDEAERDLSTSSVTEFPEPYLEKIHNNVRRKLFVNRHLAEWSENQVDGKNWPSVWPGPAPFNPYKVPLDIRMGIAPNKVVTPGKFGNLELMKIQNFLHLTPPAIKGHCQALKEFCTEWPKELKTDEDCEREFPMEIHTADYVQAGQSQRNPKIRLCNLALNHHARFKLIKLAGNRYNPKTDMLTITISKCPLRKQNRQYLNYLLTVLYFESWKTEHWEKRENMEEQDGIYWWNHSNSYKNLTEVLKSNPNYSSFFDESGDVKDSIEELPEIVSYRNAVENLKTPDQNATIEETRDTVKNYKKSVESLLGMVALQ